MTCINLYLRSIFATVFLCTATFLSGCTTIPGAADLASLEKIHRIGVVSAAGDKLFHYKIGFTVFGNDNASADISDWRLDDAWENAISDATAAIGDYDVVNLDIDRSPLYETYPKENAWPRQWRVIDFKKTAPYFQKLAQQHNLDAIIVLSSDGYDVGRANVILEGPSIYSTDGPLTKATSGYWLVTRLYLVDGVTGAPLASSVLGNEQFFSVTVPNEAAAEPLNGKMFGDYSEQEQLYLRQRFIEMPTEWWEPSITKLLTPKQ